jgi:hypothetical protein
MNRIALILAGAIGFASETCIPTGNLDPKAETGDTTATGDTQGMGPCESGFCDLTVSEARVECASDTTAAPEPIEVVASGPGTLGIHHHRVQQGCCPELAVSALQDLRNDRIEVSYDLYDDMCDCICDLDVLYTLGDLYAGTFTLEAHGDSSTVTVE